MKNVRIYPNPANDILYIESTLNIEQVGVYDISGRLLKQFSTINKDHNISINDLVNGIYLVKITIEQKDYIYKMIKD